MWYNPYNEIFIQKRNEVLTHATTWMSCENIILIEKSQTQIIQTIKFHLHEALEHTNLIHVLETRLAFSSDSTGEGLTGRG